MSEKSLDPQGRMRSKTIAFRMSPEEADLLQRYADMSGMTKQDYLISRVLQRDVTVIPRKRMQLYMEENMLYVFKELRRLDAGQVLSHDLSELVRMLAGIFAALGGEDEAAAASNDLIMGLERQTDFFSADQDGPGPHDRPHRGEAHSHPWAHGRRPWLPVRSAQVGKSWLGMEIGICVAAGAPLWGHQVRKRAVLHLPLEDRWNFRRCRLSAQNRDVNTHPSDQPKCRRCIFAGQTI